MSLLPSKSNIMLYSLPWSVIRGSVALFRLAGCNSLLNQKGELAAQGPVFTFRHGFQCFVGIQGDNNGFPLLRVHFVGPSYEMLRDFS